MLFCVLLKFLLFINLTLPFFKNYSKLNHILKRIFKLRAVRLIAKIFSYINMRGTEDENIHG